MQRSLYIAYFTGAHGNSVGLFYMDSTAISGVDVGGIKYDGQLRENDDGSREGLVRFTLADQQNLITGVVGTPQPQEIQVFLKLPKNFDDGQIVRIETPVGVVNAKFEKLKDLP